MKIIDLELWRNVDAMYQISYIMDGSRIDRMELYREGLEFRAEIARAKVLRKEAAKRRSPKR